MSLPPLEGHDETRRAVAAAWARGRLPSVLLLHGPPGVGKQRFAHWIGQLLVCSSPSPVEGPCGSCRECRLVLRLEHPDVHWFVPLSHPGVRGSREREDRALEDARIEWIEEARARPLRPSHAPGVRGLHLGTIRNLRSMARKPPSAGARQLFVVADAEELVAQEASQEAANALLKTLEEPPPGTYFVLTSGEPGRLLSTIRSRTTALYLAALPRARVEAFLRAVAGAGEEAAARAALLSGGSIGRALGFLPEGDDDGPLEKLRQDAFHLVRAALSPDPGDRFRRALAFPPSGARGLRELLGFVEGWLRDLGAAAAGLEDAILNRDARSWLLRVSTAGMDPAGPSRALSRVETARELASGNVNPQLVIGGLLFDLHRELAGPGAVPDRGLGAGVRG